jgi:hypothetical protein
MQPIDGPTILQEFLEEVPDAPPLATEDPGTLS